MVAHRSPFAGSRRHAKPRVELLSRLERPATPRSYSSREFLGAVIGFLVFDDEDGVHHAQEPKDDTGDYVKEQTKPRTEVQQGIEERLHRFPGKKHSQRREKKAQPSTASPNLTS